MKKKAKTIIGISIAAIVIFLIVYYAIKIHDEMYGNSRAFDLVQKSAEEYLEANYSDLDMRISNVTYNFKDKSYSAHAVSDSSIDTHFQIYGKKNGRIFGDNYAFVLDHSTTFDRVYEQYYTLVEALLDAPDFMVPHTIGLGELELYWTEEGNPRSAEYGIQPPDLILDYPYDMKELGVQCGRLTFYVEDNDVSYENAAAILMRIKKAFDSSDIAFHAIDFVLEKPKDDDPSNDQDIRVANVFYSEIDSNDFIEILQKKHKELTEYYNRMDQIKN